MPLPYRPWTEEEDQMRGIIEKGVYPFKVIGVERKPTKNGAHEMIVLDLAVIDSQGKNRRVRDWLVMMDEMGWKLRHAAASCGLLEKYQAGLLEATDFLLKDGAVELGIKEDNGKKNNHVIDYMKPVEMAADDFKDDDIKF